MTSSSAFGTEGATEVFHRATRHLGEQNFNTAALLMVEYFEELRLREREKLQRALAKAIESYPHVFTKRSADTILSIDASEIHPALRSALAHFRLSKKPDPVVGCVHCLLLSGEAGVVRTLEIFRAGKSTRSSGERAGKRLQSALLHGVIAASDSYIRKTGIPLVVDLKKYACRISDVHGREVEAIAGASAGLALAVAAFSRMSGLPVPREIAFTGEIRLDGSILPVEGVLAKACAFFRERPHSRLFIVPEGNTDECSGLAAGTVRGATTLEEVLEAIWGERFRKGKYPSRPAERINIKRAVQDLNNPRFYIVPGAVVSMAGTLIDHLKMKRTAYGRAEYAELLFKLHSRRGLGYAHLGRFDLAMKDYKKANKLAENSDIDKAKVVEFLRSEAATLFYAFQYGEAEELLREALKLSPSAVERGNTLCALSEFYTHMGRRYYRKAEQSLKEAHLLVPLEERARCYIYLARLYTAWGHFKEAGRAISASTRTINKLPPDQHQNNARYRDLARVILLYRRGTAEKHRRSLGEAARIAVGQTDESGHFTQGLIRKYSGLAQLALGKTNEGCMSLIMSIEILESEGSQTYGLLAATVRLELARLLLARNGADAARAQTTKALAHITEFRLPGDYFREDNREIKRLLRQSNLSLPHFDRIAPRLTAKIPYC